MGVGSGALLGSFFPDVVRWLWRSCRSPGASSLGASREQVNECPNRAGKKNEKEDYDVLVEPNAINDHPNPECQEWKDDDQKDGLDASDPSGDKCGWWHIHELRAARIQPNVKDEPRPWPARLLRYEIEQSFSAFDLTYVSRRRDGHGRWLWRLVRPVWGSHQTITPMR